jgi:hypothetical protein
LLSTISAVVRIGHQVGIMDALAALACVGCAASPIIAIRIRLTTPRYRSVLTYIVLAGVLGANIPIIAVSIAAQIFVNAAVKISIAAVLLALRAAASQNWK